MSFWSSPIQGIAKQLTYNVRGQLVSRPWDRTVAGPLTGTPRGASRTGLLSASAPLLKLFPEEADPRVGVLSPGGGLLNILFLPTGFPPFRTGEGGAGCM